MLLNKKKLEKALERELQSKARKFVEDLDMEEDDFTIDNIENIMSKFHKETDEIIIKTVSDVIESFDETKIIAKKKQK